MVERFAKERARETKGNKFQLGDDEDGDDLLTHGGKALRLVLLLFFVVSVMSILSSQGLQLIVVNKLTHF